MVRSGSTLTYYVEGQTGGVFRPEVGVLRSQVIATLSQHFTVREVTINVRTLLGSISALELWNYDYSAIVRITARMDYGHVDDIGSIIANAFYVAGGALPVVSSDWHDGPFGGIETTGPPIVENVTRALTDLPKLLVFGAIAVVAIVAFSPLGKAGVKFSAV